MCLIHPVWTWLKVYGLLTSAHITARFLFAIDSDFLQYRYRNSIAQGNTRDSG